MERDNHVKQRVPQAFGCSLAALRPPLQRFSVSGAESLALMPKKNLKNITIITNAHHHRILAT